ncbi:MAG: hypothetical protein M3Y26_10905 [Actinomycetota bacterium]|nr:hypothetical protein [Actinomycetota bacterium]
MTPDELADALREVLADAARAGEIPHPGPVDAPVRASGRGWTSPLALRVAAAVGMPVGRVAGTLADRLAKVADIETVSVRDGFIAVTPRAARVSQQQAVELALSQGQAYGRRPGDWLGPPSRWVSAAARMPRTLENPVFLVPLARARLTRQARRGEPVTREPPQTSEPVAGQEDPALPASVAEFPGVARRAATSGDPEVLARFLEPTARLVLASRDVDPDLAAALALVLGNGLDQLGTAAPDHI